MESIDVSLQWHAARCSYVGVAGLVFLFYDHLLTLADEIQYIWSAKHSFPKFLFLLVHYLVPCALILHLYQLTGSVRPNDDADTIWFNLAVCLGIFSMAIGNFLVLLRLWVLWNKNRKLIAYTLLLFIIAQVGVVTCAIVVLVGVTPSLAFDSAYKMCTLQKRSILGALYVPPAILDALALLAVSWDRLACHPRTQKPVMELLKSLFTERFGYLLILFLMRLLNLGTTLFAPLHFVFLGVCFIWAATTVTVSRLIIDLRKNGVIHAASKASELPTPLPHDALYIMEAVGRMHPASPRLPT